jgi:hypothetical protein
MVLSERVDDVYGDFTHEDDKFVAVATKATVRSAFRAPRSEAESGGVRSAPARGGAPGAGEIVSLDDRYGRHVP